MNTRRLITGASVAITLILGFWLSGHVLPPPIRATVSTKGTDYTARNIVLNQFRQNGQLRYRLQAARLIHTAANNQTRLTNPILVVHPEKGSPVTMESPSAILLPGNTIIHMPHQVVITHTGDHGQSIRALASNVTVDTAKQIATSPASVSIRGTAYLTRGTGLAINFNRQTFNLLKNVHSVYTRPTRKP